MNFTQAMHLAIFSGKKVRHKRWSPGIYTEWVAMPKEEGVSYLSTVYPDGDERPDVEDGVTLSDQEEVFGFDWEVME